MGKMANRLLLVAMLAIPLGTASPVHAASGKPAAFVDMVQMLIEFFVGPGMGDEVSDMAVQGPHNASRDWNP